eukprot:3960092-Amphidinium_carterae.2
MRWPWLRLAGPGSLKDSTLESITPGYTSLKLQYTILYACRSSADMSPVLSCARRDNTDTPRD